MPRVSTLEQQSHRSYTWPMAMQCNFSNSNWCEGQDFIHYVQYSNVFDSIPILERHIINTREKINF